jgi:glycosyltransferase involved in cell wall biosynthesis
LLKLTVITPTLNQGRYLERAIRSVLDQGYRELEYLVVDGGSTDETVDVIERYQDRIDWWLSEPDEGQPHAIAKGIERASGDVIAFLNSDDYYLPGAFATAIGALERSDASWVAGAAIQVDEHDRPRETPLGPVWVPALPEENQFRPRRSIAPRGRAGLVAHPWCVAQPASFWRRELFERYGGFRRDMHFGFDVEFMTRLAIEGETPLLLPGDHLAACVLHDEAKSSDPSKWAPDWKLMRRLHKQRLTPGERRRVQAWEVWEATRIPRLLGFVLYKAIPRVMQLGGDLLEYVPERARPKIRTRDRRAS